MQHKCIIHGRNYSQSQADRYVSMCTMPAWHAQSSIQYAVEAVTRCIQLIMLLFISYRRCDMLYIIYLGVNYVTLFQKQLLMIVYPIYYRSRIIGAVTLLKYVLRFFLLSRTSFALLCIMKINTEKSPQCCDIAAQHKSIIYVIAIYKFDYSLSST